MYLQNQFDWIQSLQSVSNWLNVLLQKLVQYWLHAKTIFTIQTINFLSLIELLRINFFKIELLPHLSSPDFAKTFHRI